MEIHEYGAQSLYEDLVGAGRMETLQFQTWCSQKQLARIGVETAKGSVREGQRWAGGWLQNEPPTGF